MPHRRWHRPTLDGLVDDVLLTAAFAGGLLLGTGDPERLLTGVGIFLVGFVTSQYRTEDDSPEAETKRLVHDLVTRGELPQDPDQRRRAIEHAQRWSARLRRVLLRAGLGVLAWCAVTVVTHALLVRHWPETSAPRAWGAGIAITGATGWYLHAAVPAVRRARRLRRLL
ncbi:hypothetical protein ACFQ46_23625 [Kineococcus sp. GCM10028916]|uniref:hypothetical protein n=1 Tax=Kineococcus sp. GCM10028916 TaxID=3273394 RepID=UPI00362AD535